jgi:hypothetical protein
MLTAISSKVPSFIPAIIASFTAGSIAVSIASLVMLASIGFGLGPAQARDGGGQTHIVARSGGQLAATAAKPGGRVTGKSVTAGSVHCVGPGCPNYLHKLNRANVIGTAANGDPRPIVRDHRNGGGGSGGVTVTEGKPRPPGPICAGWAC